jgi:hypothetical protein
MPEYKRIVFLRDQVLHSIGKRDEDHVPFCYVPYCYTCYAYLLNKVGVVITRKNGRKFQCLRCYATYTPRYIIKQKIRERLRSLNATLERKKRLINHYKKALDQI